MPASTTAVSVMHDTNLPQTLKTKQEDTTTVLPVMVNVITRSAVNVADENDACIYGTRPGMLLLVGVVESLSQDSLGFEMILNDSTGRIKARYYVQDADFQHMGLEVGKYVTVAGHLRLEPEVHLQLAVLRRVCSPDEISYHVIEAAYVSLKMRRCSLESLEPATPAKKAVVPLEDPSSNQHKSSIKSAKKAVVPLEDAVAAARWDCALNEASEFKASPMLPVPLIEPVLEGSALRNAITLFVQKQGETSEGGVPVATIYLHFLQVSETSIRAALQQLCEDGDLFNTIDDDHFQAL